MDREAEPAAGPSKLAELLIELQQLERELAEQRYLRRADGLERVRDAVRRLNEVGSPAGVIARAGEELCAAAELDRVLLSRVEQEALLPMAGWVSNDERADNPLAPVIGRPLPLRYPLVEAEVAQGDEGVIVNVPESGPRAMPELKAVLAWETYAVAPIQLEGNTRGLLHADRLGGERQVDELDLELVTHYARGLGQAYESAVLREQFQRQRRQLLSAAHWINARTLRSSADETTRGASGRPAGEDDLAELLTPRELDIMRLIARGQSNPEIAQALLLGEGTVKYHVKNILRKLQARSRTEALSRYLQLRPTANLR